MIDNYTDLFTVSFNTELTLLAKAADISERVHPHLFRHKFYTSLAQDIKGLSYAKQILVLKRSAGWTSSMSAAVYIDIVKMESPEIFDALSKHLQNNSNHALKHIIISKLNELRSLSNNISITDNVDEIETLFNQLISTNKNSSAH